MRIEGITDVFFDLDHTLWDFDRNSALTFAKIFEINNIKIDLNIFLSHYQSINLNYWKLYREEKIDKESLRYGRLNDTFSAINFKVDEVQILKISDDYIKYLSSFNFLIKNTLEVLNYLNGKYRLHIITNGFDEVQQSKLEDSKINHYFQTVTNSEMVGVKKPNPKIFNFALNIANTIPEKSIMIGDNYEADILGAINVGIESVFFDVHNTVMPDHIIKIDNLLSLKEYL